MGVQINEDKYFVITQSLDANVTSTNTTQELDFTVKGLKVGDAVFVNKPSLSTGVGVCGARVKAADTLSITYVNATGSGVNPAAETYTILVFRPEKTFTSVPA